MDEALRRQACDLVAREARLLDARAWDDWLALYTDDAEFWVPTWRDEHQLTEDPARELSFMYLRGRALLAERVARIRSGNSAASMPLPRTVHLVAGSLVAEAGDALHVDSAWTTQVWQHKDAALVTYTGRYAHELVLQGTALRIRRKKVILVNDRLRSQVDFFHL